MNDLRIFFIKSRFISKVVFLRSENKQIYAAFV